MCTFSTFILLPSDHFVVSLIGHPALDRIDFFPQQKVKEKLNKPDSIRPKLPTPTNLSCSKLLTLWGRKL